MIDLYLLEQLIAVKKYGTLINAAEYLGISQPALSKSMKKLEDIMGISLFNRSNRRIEVNETGKLFADKAAVYLNQGEFMLREVYAFEKSLHTISFGSCAPMPIYDIPPMLTSLYPHMSIITSLAHNDELLSGLDRNDYQLVALNSDPIREYLYVYKYKTEKLFVSVPKAHPFYEKIEIYPDDLNGQFVLVYTDIGIWTDWLKNKFPGINLMMMDDMNALRDAIGLGTALSFISDNVLQMRYNNPDQKIIPIIAPDITMPFYLTCKKTEYSTFKKLCLNHKSCGMEHF